MRVLLCAPWYFPDSTGGTEVYVRGLARELTLTGLTVAVAAPAIDGSPAQYEYDGVPVHRFVAPESVQGEIDVDPQEPAGFAALLDAWAPTVVDLHSLASGLGLAHLRAARRRGAVTISTLHLPGIICARGGFMRFGVSPCSGDLRREPCTACRLDAQGVPPPVGRLLGHLPGSLARRSALTHLPGAARRALAAAGQDARRRDWLRLVADASDRLVAPSAWLVDVLLRNEVAPEKVVLCRQGVEVAPSPPARTRARGPLRVGFLGRHDPQKGLGLLIDVVRQLPATPACELHAWGIARSADERAYFQSLSARAAGDARIVLHADGATPAEVYARIDVLAVPSLSFETGPLVVLEAQAAGLPVIGSDLGGIAERVTDGVNGLLVPPGDRPAWSRAIRRLASDAAFLASLRPTTAPRTTTDVAGDTRRLYGQLAGTPRAGAAS